MSLNLFHKKSDGAPDKKGKKDKDGPRADGMRETIESVVIAFVLAFLFRTFEAEAFVIPTGSMATTLMGRHKDVECPKCGYRYQVSASSEVDTEGNELPGLGVTHATCPMCRYTREVTDETSYNGDRILVTKFHDRDPKRWDVIVFRYPEAAATNYIKRLIGLPGETIEIRGGDIYVRRLGESQARIARKPPETMRAMLRMVYDNGMTTQGKIPEQMTAHFWPPRWQPTPPEPDRLKDHNQQLGWLQKPSAGWWRSDKIVVQEDGKQRTIDGFGAFETDGSASRPVWIRYQHFVPNHYSRHPNPVWGRLEEGPLVTPPIEESNVIRPIPVLDFLAYNAGVPQPRDDYPPQHVSDLALECELTAGSNEGAAILELIKLGHRFRCRLDLATGAATLSILDSDGELLPFADGKTSPIAKNAFPGSRHTVLFSNVDRQLRLFVDGRLVGFAGETTYDIDFGEGPGVLPADWEANYPSYDFTPAAVASDGARLRADHLRLYRDIHYLKKSPHASRNYVLDESQFFVLGDNTARSADSRYWNSQHFVSRDQLIGKALLIYWPHSWNRPVPFWPNWRRMGFVR